MDTYQEKNTQMSIENRLKEERSRLGFSQEAFALLANAAKRAQVYYEKGDRRPDADYLSAVAEAGADVLYILTGRREGVAGSGLTDREAISQMDQIESALQAADVTLPSGNAAHRNLLQSIALDVTLPDRTRARADMILRVGFSDEAAEDRFTLRERRIHSIFRRAHVLVDDAARVAGYSPSLQIQSALERLIATEPDAPDDVIKWIITDLIAAIRAEGGRGK